MTQQSIPLKAYIPPEHKALCIGLGCVTLLILAPSASGLCYRYQQVGIQKALQTQHEPSQTQSKPLLTRCEAQSEPAEYSSCWVCEGLVCLGHVDFMLFVLILFALCTQCKHGFWWNTGLVMLKTDLEPMCKDIREIELLCSSRLVRVLHVWCGKTLGIMFFYNR